MRTARHLVMAAALLLALTGPATAQVLQEAGRLACGAAESVALAGGLACESDGSAVIIRDAASGDELGRLDLDHSVQALVASDDRLYASTLGSTLVGVDLADPAAPSVLWEIATRDWCLELDVLGTYLLAGCASWGLLVFDLAPATPTEVAWWYEPESVTAIARDDSLAYLSCIDHGVYAMDLTDPASPAVVWHDPGLRAYGLALVGDRLTVALHDEVVVLDVTIPDAPVPTLRLPLAARHAAARAPLVLLAGGSPATLWLVDPVSGETVGSLPAPAYVADLAVEADQALAAAGDAGTLVLDLPAGAPPGLRRTDPATGETGAVALDAGIAVVATGRPSLLVLAVAADGPPTVLATVALAAAVADVAYDHPRAVLAMSGGLRALDLDDPSAPAVGALLPLPSPPRAVTLADGLAYAACGTGGLHVIDVADIEDPQPHAFAPAIGEFADVAVSGGHALVAAGDAGLRVYDARPGGTLAPMGSLAGTTDGIAVLGPVAVLTELFGMRTVDVSVPAQPQLLGSLELPVWLDALAVAAGHAYLRVGSQDVVCVDLGSPADPSVVASFDGPHLSEALAADRDLVVGTWPSAGVLVLRNLLATAAPPPAITPPRLACRPNPANPRTVVAFAVPTAGRVRLEIHDLRGRHVRTLLAGDLPAGDHRRTWNGRDESGRLAPSGVYLVRLTTPAGMARGRVTLAR